jgi:hypothetical protein
MKLAHGVLAIGKKLTVGSATSAWIVGVWGIPERAFSPESVGRVATCG